MIEMPRDRREMVICVLYAAVAFLVVYSARHGRYFDALFLALALVASSAHLLHGSGGGA